jgi:hypothetical protein
MVGNVRLGQIIGFVCQVVGALPKLGICAKSYRPTLGYRTFGPNGYSSNSMPNGFGGMRTYQSNGVTTNTMPNGLGGMNTFVTRPPSFVNPTFGTYGR